MRKKKFEAPIAEIIYFDESDILTASTDSFEGEWVPIGRSIPDVNDPPTL